MTEPLPDDEAFYTSPLDVETLAAIGRLITLWAAIESAAAMQVARIVAVSYDKQHQAWAIDVPGFAKGALVSQGTAIKASLTQIQNLLSGKAAELKPHADAILKIKMHRDALAHNSSGPVTRGVTLISFGASRAKMGKTVSHTADEIQELCSQLKRHSRAIDTIISDAIWFNWARIEEAQKLWSEAQER